MLFFFLILRHLSDIRPKTAEVTLKSTPHVLVVARPARGKQSVFQSGQDARAAGSPAKRVALYTRTVARCARLRRNTSRRHHYRARPETAVPYRLRDFSPRRHRSSVSRFRAVPGDDAVRRESAPTIKERRLREEVYHKQQASTESKPRGPEPKYPVSRSERYLSARVYASQQTPCHIHTEGRRTWPSRLFDAECCSLPLAVYRYTVFFLFFFSLHDCISFLLDALLRDVLPRFHETSRKKKKKKEACRVSVAAVFAEFRSLSTVLRNDREKEGRASCFLFFFFNFFL